MTAKERREQLIAIGRETFAERGMAGTSVEEIALRAGVSKPVVYEHFGGKEGLYAVVVDREMAKLEQILEEAMAEDGWLERIEASVVALLTYVEQQPDGFRILVRDPVPGDNRSYSTFLNTATVQVSHYLGEGFAHRGFDPSLAVMYAQAIVGMVSQTAQWWLDEREPGKQTVAAHIVNLCWNGLSHMQAAPKLNKFTDLKED